MGCRCESLWSIDVSFGPSLGSRMPAGSPCKSAPPPPPQPTRQRLQYPDRATGQKVDTEKMTRTEGGQHDPTVSCQVWPDPDRPKRSKPNKQDKTRQRKRRQDTTARPVHRAKQTQQNNWARSQQHQVLSKVDPQSPHKRKYRPHGLTSLHSKVYVFLFCFLWRAA
jgi:hypothetical protein